MIAYDKVAYANFSNSNKNTFSSSSEESLGDI